MANKQIEELVELVSVADGDELIINDVSDSTEAKKITKGNLFSTTTTGIALLTAGLQSLDTVVNPASASAPASLDLHEDTDNGTNKITIISPSAISSDKTLTLPDETGTVATREYAADWKALSALAWVSQDGSTNVVNATGDMTATLSPGMRLKTQQDQALTAYWNFDASSASQVGSFNGTDTAITYTAGKFGNAATFNGTTSKIVIADNASLKPTGEFTIGCWFKKTAAGSSQSIFQSYSANTAQAGFRVEVGSGNFIGVYSGKNTGTAAGTDFSSFTGMTNVADNAYHYLVCSFRNNYLQVYIDGKLETSGYCLTPAYAATNYVRVGCLNLTGSDANFFGGQIDDLFLINGYALDEKTIKAKYDAQTAQGTGNITVQKYALVTAVAPYAAGVTPITIWGGTDYSLANATISSPYYATVSQPFGFDRSENKWKTELKVSTTLSTASPVNGTWNSYTSIVLPIGKQKVYFNGIMSAVGGANGAYATNTLSTANNSETDNEFSSSLGFSPSGIQAILPFSRAKEISLIAKTTYYLNMKANTTAISSISYEASGGPTIVKSVSSYI